MGNSTLDSKLSLAAAGRSPPRVRHLAIESANGSDAPRRSNDPRLMRRKPAHKGERYDWNRPAGLATAIYVHRHGRADPDFWYRVSLADADGHFPEHQHPRHQRCFQLHG